MKVKRYNSQGQSQADIEIQDELLILNKRGTQAVHDAVVGYLANQRQGNAKAKRRGEVSGGGKKPWRQKGTGRARAGSIRSPLWRHGGVVFGPLPRDWSLKVSKKVKALAFRKALSDRLAAGDVLVLDDLKLQSHKTKDFVAVLRSLNVSDNALLVGAGGDENLTRASRNVPWLELTRPELLNAYDLVRFNRIVFTAPAFESVTQRLAGEKSA
jgi:large subunit ribosomal protein L4